MPDISELRDFVSNTVKARLARDEVALAFVVRQWRSVEIARVAKSAGFDTLYIDLEHSPISVEAAAQISTTALEVGITTVVRVPGPDEYFIGQALDGGAMGIVAPHVETAEQAREWVRLVKYPPLGRRSLSATIPQFRAESWPVAESRTVINDETLLVVMIESATGGANAAEIASVEGVDVLLIGTNDLAADLGLFGQYDHPDITRIYLDTIAAARSAGKHVGVGGLYSRPDLVAKFVAAGARWISAGTDQQFLISSARTRAAELRQLPRDKRD